MIGTVDARPAESLFIDDTAEHLAAARSLGSGKSINVNVRKILNLGENHDGYIPTLVVLPDGLIAYPVAGAKPTGKATMSSPEVLGAGSYKLIDPVSRTVTRTVDADDVNVWEPMGTGSKAVDWVPDLPPPWWRRPTAPVPWCPTCTGRTRAGWHSGSSTSAPARGTRWS